MRIKNVYKVFGVVFMIFSLFSCMSAQNVQPTNPNEFIGKWRNANPETRGIVSIEISKTNNNLFIEVWGSCHPNPCEWGKEELILYNENVGKNTQIRSMIATYDPGFAETIVIVEMIDENKIRTSAYTKFKDDSGRSNYSASEIFIK